MYAVITDGSHQYRVEEGQRLQIERQDVPEDSKAVTFDRVLLVGGLEGGPKVGRPVVLGASVQASVLAEVKGRKITILKHHRRKGYHRKQGHRQKYLHIEIQKIELLEAVS